MRRIEYDASILKDGQIFLPEEIRNRYFLKPNQKVKVIIEIPASNEETKRRYSFKKVRNLLKGIHGDMSSDIIADREDRI